MPSSLKTQRIGIFGGTFDPVHLQHIHVAEQAIQSLKLDILYFIPNKIPSYRPAPLANAEHRLMMLKIAIRHHPQYQVDDGELKRDGYSYSIDTLKLYRERFPNADIFFLIGSDQLIDLPNWDGYAAFQSLYHFAVAERPGFSIPKATVFFDPNVVHAPKTGLFFKLATTPQKTSATEIRSCLLKQGDFSTLADLDSEVLAYIKRLHLYNE